MKTAITLLPAAISLLLAACTSDSSTPGQDPRSARGNPNENGEIQFSYETNPIAVEPDERVALTEANAPEFARLALTKSVALAINGIINSQNLAPMENFFSSRAGDITEACNSGGNVRVSSTDRNGNGAIDADDRFSLLFDRCDGSSGELRTDFVTYTGSATEGSVTTNHYASAIGFQGVQASTGSSGQSDGVEGRRIILRNGRFQYIVHSPSGRLQETEGGRGSADYRSRYYADVQGAEQSAGTNTRIRINFKDKGDFSTRMDLPATAAFAASSDDLLIVASDNAVAEGQLSVRSGGRLDIRALGDSTGRYRVQVSLDANDDGVFEKSCTFDYAAVMDGTASFSDDSCAGRGSSGPIPTPILTAPALGKLLGSLSGALRLPALQR